MADESFDISVTLEDTALDVRVFFMEKRDLVNSLRFTGSQWEAEFEGFTLDEDADLDLHLLAEGLPDVECTLTVTFDGKQPVKIKRTFSGMGRASFTKSIVPSKLTDKA